MNLTTQPSTGPDQGTINRRIEALVLEATIEGPASGDWHRYEFFKKRLQGFGLPFGDPRYHETIRRLTEALAL